MYTKLRLILVVTIAGLMAGCANPIHSAWAYKPLQNAKSGAFLPATERLDYREFKSIGALADAETEMYREGYVMIGYVNMYSPQFEMIGRGGAKQWGAHIGARRALHTFGRGHFLASYWAKPKNLPLGAFYTDGLPEDARRTVNGLYGRKGAVLVEIVSEDSPAFYAGIRPGDLLLEMNGEFIDSAEQLGETLKSLRDQEATLTVWSMYDGPPRRITLGLR